MPRSHSRRQGRRWSSTLLNAIRHSALSALLLLPCTLLHAADTRVEATRTALQAAVLDSEQQAKPPTLAREQLLRRSTIGNVQLSPDGRYLLFRKRGEQQTDLWLQELASDRQTRVLADIRRLDSYWSADSQLIWLADEQGLAVFDLGKSTATRILKWDERRKQRFLTVDSNAAGYALISEKLADTRNQNDNSTNSSGDLNDRWRYRYLRVDASGKSLLLLEASQPLRDVLLTAQGELAFTAAYEGQQYDTVIRRHDGNSTRELLRCVGVERCRFVGYNHAQQTLLVLSHHGEDTMALQRWQAGSDRWQTVHRDPAGIADASTLLWQAGKQEWLAVAYHPDRRRWYGNGAQTQAQLAALARQLPEANLQLISTADGKRWLVQATNANWQQDRHYLYSPERNVLQPLFEHERASEPLTLTEQLAAAVPISYRATDGMQIHGYVYLPRGVVAAKAPLIASLHGGPYNRDRDDYDAMVQLLVNRGYAVFSPNFRASTGYGQRYLHAANADFGNGKVLSDIIDGLDFLLAQGIGDRNKQAVIGHSFGGYASLLAVSHHPARFRFAVASAGPAEFGWGMKWIANNGGSAIPEDGPPAEIFFAHYGVHLADTAWQQKMRRESPLQLLPQLRTPLYLWAGARDDRVPLKEISHYAGEAKRYGKPLSLLIDPDSGHNPGAALNLEAIVYLIESAAAQHFAGAVTPPSAALKAFVAKNLRIDDNGVRRLSK